MRRQRKFEEYTIIAHIRPNDRMSHDQINQAIEQILHYFRKDLVEPNGAIDIEWYVHNNLVSRG